jgi:hypothetical protein
MAHKECRVKGRWSVDCESYSLMVDALKPAVEKHEEDKNMEGLINSAHKILK